MAFADNIAGDYAYFDGGESVELRQIRADGATSVTVANAVNNPMSRAGLTLAGVDIVGDERQWSLNATQIGSLGVQVSDTFTDAAGDVWRVISASLRTLDTRWLVVARKQVQR